MARRLISLLLFGLIAISSHAVDARAARFAVANAPTPMLNTPNIAKAFEAFAEKRQTGDNCSLMKEIEYVAFPGTTFKIHRKIRKSNATIYKVTTPDYPYPTSGGYYIDSRFVTVSKAEPTQRVAQLPAKKAIVKNLLAARGTPYVWGGNVRAGIPSVNPPLKGVDCSGLLFEATNGYTPRNTSKLIKFGKAVPIAGKSVNQIARAIRPLDIIVWRGHAMIAMAGDSVIESRLDYDKTTPGCQNPGVRIRPLRTVLKEVLTTRVPVNNYDDPVAEGQKKFVVRRWN